MRGFTEAYVLRLRNLEAILGIEDIAEGASDVAIAAKMLGSGNPTVASASWRYLAGQKLSVHEMALAGTSKPAIDTSHEYAAVHAVFAHIIETETGGKRLV